MLNIEEINEIPNKEDYMQKLKEFKELLCKIEENDTNYDIRYGLVLKALYLANELGYESGIRIDPSEPDWPVVYIELPTGQVSWHMPCHKYEWDGHSTEEKYERIRSFCEKNYM